MWKKTHDIIRYQENDIIRFTRMYFFVGLHETVGDTPQKASRRPSKSMDFSHRISRQVGGTSKGCFNLFQRTNKNILYHRDPYKGVL